MTALFRVFRLLRPCPLPLCLAMLLVLAACGGTEPPSPEAAAPPAPEEAPAPAPVVEQTSPPAPEPAPANEPSSIITGTLADEYTFDELIQDPANPRLPNLENADHRGDKPGQDILPTVEGGETTVSGYEFRNIAVIVFRFPNGKVYAFSMRNITTGDERTYFDETGDGIFEQEGDSGNVDEKAYGY